MTEGYDALVDRLMSMDGLDREEAEVLAVAQLTAGRGVPRRMDERLVATSAPAVSCAHDDFHFSRVLCACDAMHNYCNACGEQLDACDQSGCVCGDSDPGDCCEGACQ